MGEKIRARPTRNPIWYNKTIKAAHRKRGRAAKRWHSLALEARRWEDGVVDARVFRAHEELKLHKKNVRQLERQARARHEAGVRQWMKEAGLSDQSRAVKKDRRGKALRQAEGAKRGKQLKPSDFTKFMGEQQVGGEKISPRTFKVDSRKFRRRVKRAIRNMARNKVVGIDSIHSEMLQTALDVFASLLAQWWIVIGQTGIVP